MVLKRKWSITLVGMFSITMLTMLLMLIGGTSAQAASGQSVPRVFHDVGCDGPPWLTDPYCFAGNAHPIIWDVYAEGDSDGRASGQGELQYKGSSFVLDFGRVEQVLLDAEQTPAGAIFSGQGSTSENGLTEQFSFTYAAMHMSDGVCCTIEIQAPEIDRSGAIRFQASGTLHFD
jgi:hypothetical protein